MSKFKKGDKVRVVGTSTTAVTFGLDIGGLMKIGHEGFVQYESNEGNGYRVGPYFFATEDLELVSEESSEPENSDNISVKTDITIELGVHKIYLTKEEAKELSDKLLKELL